MVYISDRTLINYYMESDLLTYCVPIPCPYCGRKYMTERCVSCKRCRPYIRWRSCKICHRRTNPRMAVQYPFPNYCYKHQHCQKLGCENFATKATEYNCTIHKPCLMAGCTQFATAKSDNQYCTGHTCAIEKCSRHILCNLPICNAHSGYKCCTNQCENVPVYIYGIIGRRKIVYNLSSCVYCGVRMALPGTTICPHHYIPSDSYNPGVFICRALGIESNENIPIYLGCTEHMICLWDDCMVYVNLIYGNRYCTEHQCKSCLGSLLCKDNMRDYIQKYLATGYFATIPFDIVYSIWLFLYDKK